MKTFPWHRLLLASLVASVASAPALARAASAGVPLLYQSAGTDAGSGPEALTTRVRVGSARLSATAGGRVNVSFDTGRFVYLGFSFTASSPFAISVEPQSPLSSVRVFANGVEQSLVAGSATAYATAAPQPGPVSVVVRLERGDAARVPVTLAVRGFRSCPTLQQNPCGEVLQSAPEGLTYDLSRTAPADAPPDVLIPAVTRAAGLRGPVRSDLTLANRADAPIILTLVFTGADGARPEPVPVTLAPHSRRRIEDVVAFLFQDGVAAQGVIGIRGFVPLAAGDITAETYYDQGEGGHIGTSLPLFTGEAARVNATILAASTEGNPRLIVFSSAPEGSELSTHDATLDVAFADGEALSIPITVYGGAYASARIFDITGGKEGEGLVTLQSDDPTLHAVLIRNDAASGSPFVVASN